MHKTTGNDGATHGSVLGAENLIATKQDVTTLKSFLFIEMVL